MTSLDFWHSQQININQIHRKMKQNCILNGFPIFVTHAVRYRIMIVVMGWARAMESHKDSFIYWGFVYIIRTFQLEINLC